MLGLWFGLCLFGVEFSFRVIFSIKFRVGFRDGGGLRLSWVAGWSVVSLKFEIWSELRLLLGSCLL